MPLIVAIVYRITRITRRVGSRSHLDRISRILVESGVPYTLSSALLLAATATEVEYRISKDKLQSTLGAIVRPTSCPYHDGDLNTLSCRTIHLRPSFSISFSSELARAERSQHVQGHRS